MTTNPHQQTLYRQLDERERTGTKLLLRLLLLTSAVGRLEEGLRGIQLDVPPSSPRLLMSVATNADASAKGRGGSLQI